MMKKTVLILLFLLVAEQFYAQDFTKIATINFETIEDYKKAEPNVLKCVNFLFRTPNKPQTDNRKLAKAFIIKWMSGTDHKFNIDANVADLTTGDPDLLAMYLAAMTKVALSSPNETISAEKMFEKASTLLAVYCADKKNKLRPSRKLKKLIITLN